MKKLYFLSLFAIFSLSGALAQIVKIEPSDATGDDEIRIIYDATQGTGGLVGAEKVYMHSGVVIDAPAGTEWTNVIGNWGQDDGIGQMTPVSGQTDQWEITLSPSARTYYGVEEGTNIFRLAMVFRNADGTAEGKGNPGAFSGGEVVGNGDIYVDLSVSNYVRIATPDKEDIFLESDAKVSITAEASSDVSAMAILIDEGDGFDEKISVTSGTGIAFDYLPATSLEATIKVTATINGEEVETTKDISVHLVSEVEELPLPTGMIKGINYHEDDGTKATLVLEAPGKKFVYVVGDFTDWEINESYLMNVTPDGELFWLEVIGLTSGQEYVFQYWVEGTIRVGDPYADKVADPWNDQYIDAALHNAVPDYDKDEYEIATTLQTNQTPFEWESSEDTWERPDKEDLVIYELLVRDFIGSHDYKDLKDTLSYLKNLGVNAIELMPVMEFEGNESWGYNPMYFFAPDKYYGTKDDLKEFIQAAHKEGMAVILDMVLNHAYGLNAMVKMYWDEENNKPSSDSPWFNPDATHPFNVGFDFNHESTYTQAFVDSVNAYWLQEYHFDGYRFDLSKGFTQTNNPDDVSAWSARDESRINILTRMAEKIWETDENAYVILEHFAASSEEDELAAEGMLLWRNMGYNYWRALGGQTTESFSGANAASHVTYMESHDEQRQLFEVFNEGSSNGIYNTRNAAIAMERLKMNAAFLYTLPGPKMMWQFGELGYDIDINFNGRVGNKPLVWGPGGNGYYEDPLRKYVYDAFAAIINLRTGNLEELEEASYDYDLSGDERKIVIDGPDLDIVIIGNYGLEEGSIDPSFTATGDWFDYFSGETVSVSDANAGIDLAPGEFHIYTSRQLSEGFPGVVEVFENPVSIDPAAFTADDRITITFDATKANADGTAGLVGTEKVYMHAGVVFDGVTSTNLQNIVGNLVDDGVGEMTSVNGQDNQWQITLTPSEYFSTEGKEAVRIGMFFRDADNTNVGKGFRGSVIFLDMIIDGDIIVIAPDSFDQDTEIKITYDARFGSRGLIGSEKVYMHSGVVLSEGGTEWAEGFVVGNWGQDDSIGKMTKVEGRSDQWEITLTPSEYYGLGQTTVAYRLSFVFRNADGSKKGEGDPGTWTNGFVADNGDIFYDIPNIKGVTALEDELPGFNYYPNPSGGVINFSGEIPGVLKSIQMYDLKGKQVLLKALNKRLLEPIDVSGIPPGLYLLKIFTEKNSYTLKVLIHND